MPTSADWGAPVPASVDNTPSLHCAMKVCMGHAATSMQLRLAQGCLGRHHYHRGVVAHPNSIREFPDVCEQAIRCNAG